MVGNENHKWSSLLGILQPTCSLASKSLTLELMVSVLLEKMTGHEQAVM